MNHLNRIFSTAQRLQASRSFLRDLRGLDKTTEGVEFAKAIGEGAAMGATPEDVVEQVVKAMAGNEAMAFNLLGAVQEIAKAHIEHHTRTLANGKTVNVKAYETARTAAMKQTTMAHGATFHAMRTKTPEAHENAASAHTAAAEQHGAAHEVHPMDVPEVGKEHANLKAQHQLSADYHRQEAAGLRHGHGYAVQADRAATASQGAKAAITTQQSQMAHQKAAEEHKKAHEFNPNAGHGEQAAMHTAQAQAAHTVNQSMNTPHQGSDVKAAADSSLKAFRATSAAHAASSPAAHTAAAKAHEDAINQHMGIHGARESSEDGHHGQIAKTHMALHSYHSTKAKGEEVAKAHVEGHTRTVGGKVVQVHAYDTNEHRQAAHKATDKALETGAKEDHEAAAKAHTDASQVVFDTRYHPDGMEKMRYHQEAAKGHEKEAVDMGAEEEHRTLASHPAYHATMKPKGYRGAIRPTQAVTASDAGKILIHNNPEWSKEDHLAMADKHAEAARFHQRKWSEKADEAAQATFGRPYQFTDYHISGIASDKFSDEHKDALRHHAHSSSFHQQLDAAHVAAAKARNRYGDKRGEVSKAITEDEEFGPEHVCKASAPSGYDIADRKGMDAMMVEGRPGKEKGKTKTDEGMAYCDDCDTAYPEGMKHECPGRSDVAKAHVESHTRTQGGKVVQVNEYDNKRNAANAASKAAHTASLTAHSKDEHTAAIGLHQTALRAHDQAGWATDHEGRKMMHQSNREEHGDMINAHRALATGGGGGEPDLPLRARAATNLTTIPDRHTENHEAEAKLHDEAGAAHVRAMDHPGADRAHHSNMADQHAQDARKMRADGQVAKAHVEQHTRVVGGKTVQVQSYDTHHSAAMKATGAAQGASGTAQTPEQHTQAAALHMKAAEGHRTAGNHAPETWQKEGHETMAKGHEKWANGHHAKAKAADQRADTGVDTPRHTPQDIKELENHHDYAGFGYLGHQNRTSFTDEQVAEAANKAGISKHHLAAHLLSKSGRHMLDGHGGDTPHGQAVAKFQRHLSDPKNEKEYGINNYAKELEERAPKKPVAEAPPAGGAAKPPSTSEKAPGASHPEPKVTELPGGLRHTEGKDSKGNPIHSVSSDGAILGHGKTKEEAMAMATKTTKGESPNATASEESLHGKALAAAKAVTGRDKKAMLKYSEAAHKASEHAEKTGKPEDHYVASTLHQSAGMSHDQAREDSGYKKNGHEEAWLAHRAAEKHHQTKAGDAKVSPAEMRAAAAKFGAGD